jgi:dTDP-glucose 4,6-dehydratase
MRRILVTGGAGFIGANFVYYWVQRHPRDRIVVLDSLTYAGNLQSLHAARTHPEFHFVRGDICDTPLIERLLREEGLDTIVHFAAESHVDRSIHGPDAFVHTNVLGTHSLLRAARKVWLDERAATPHRFHQVSTDEVYGSLQPGDAAFVETTPYAPNSPYSASKAASDHLVRAYHHTYGLATTISNCSNNYGPYQFPEKLIPLTIVNLLEGRPVPVYGDGRNVRDWLHVTDHCQGIERVLTQGRPGEVYNLGGRAERENIDIVRQLSEIADEMFATRAELAGRFPGSPAASGRRSDELIRFVKDRPGHDRRYAVDCSKAERELGFIPGQSAGADPLRATFAWYLDNEPWWRAVMDGRYRQWISAQYTAEPLAAAFSAVPA